jgi:hypothetical protein
MTLFKGTVSCDNNKVIVDFFLQYIVGGCKNWALLE